MGNYILTVKHEFTLGWSPGAKDADWPLAGGIIIGISNDEFYVAGTGIVVTFKPKTERQRARILRVDEGYICQWEMASRQAHER